MRTEPTIQIAFRLPKTLVGRIEDCVERLNRTNLDVKRADVVRMLLTYALDHGGCDLARIVALGGRGADDAE
ncbi:MAG TPA: hypothetical protein VFS43_39015 [Polyangiaceae bacterium]|nr:hypothetical protein [Polyangiaceae bacterium]